ncbi:MAG: cytidine deaminase [Gammaproteobacteria bacterium]|nr:cytidine deaminase [Gammaproteobacteria bacterium]
MSNRDALIEHAIVARNHAYAPYSRFFVGAAILDEHGHIHTGCNVENASFPLGACAEANAIGAMIAAGGERISGIAIVGGRDEPERCLPCGGCRQRIAEFADEDTQIVIAAADRIEYFTIAELLPDSFSLEP